MTKCIEPPWLIRWSKFHLGILIAILALTTGAYAAPEHAHEVAIGHPEKEGHIHGSHVECPLPKTALDVVRCAQEEHPSVKRARLTNQATDTLTAVARQMPNPDLDVESAFIGSSEGRAETQVALLQPIELGGKRTARVRGAQAETGQTAADLKAAQANVIIETVTKLHRLRQLEKEKAVLRDTAEALTKTIAQQRSRPALAPEQQVSLSVFRMALADAKLRESELFEEERAIEHYFHVATGHSLEEVRRVMPQAPSNFPAVTEQVNETVQSPAIIRAVAEKEAALAQLEVARANSWPTLRIGPAAMFEQDDRGSESIFGFRLMMDLPVFQANGAGRAHASRGVERAERLIDLTRAEEAHERAEQLRVYKSAVQALKDAPTVSEIEKDHQKNETLARRGLISGSLLIESHRQRADLIKGRFGRELKAIEALWQIRKFDGRIFEESL